MRWIQLHNQKGKFKMYPKNTNKTKPTVCACTRVYIPISLISKISDN